MEGIYTDKEEDEVKSMIKEIHLEAEEKLAEMAAEQAKNVDLVALGKDLEQRANEFKESETDIDDINEDSELEDFSFGVI